MSYGISISGHENDDDTPSTAELLKMVRAFVQSLPNVRTANVFDSRDGQRDEQGRPLSGGKTTNLLTEANAKPG